jgi:hypothetical protein
MSDLAPLAAQFTELVEAHLNTRVVRNTPAGPEWSLGGVFGAAAGVERIGAVGLELARELERAGANSLAVLEAIDHTRSGTLRREWPHIRLRIERQLLRAEKRAQEQAQPPPDLLLDALQALRELKATDCDTRRNAAEVAEEIQRGLDPETLKRPLAQARKKGLAGSKTGPGGGSWITPEGLEYLRDQGR